MQKRTRDEVEDETKHKPSPSIQRKYPHATVVPLKKSLGVRWSEQMQTVNTRSDEFLRSEARYKSNVERARKESRPHVEESRKIISRIDEIERNNERTLDELTKIRDSSLKDIFKLVLLQNNEKIARHKDRLNELKTIQESIHRLHEVPLRDREAIRDAHENKPYVRHLGARGGRNRKTKKMRTRKVAHVH
jgi:hypothetical protein